jgi:hypothetical protein
MHKTVLLTAALLMAAACGSFALAAPASPGEVSATTEAQAQAVVKAADSFLNLLSSDQRQKVLYSFDDSGQRARWSNFPTTVVRRGGISLKDMSAPQQEAVMKLLATVLSPMGLEKVNAIRAADEAFKTSHGGGPGQRGGRGLGALFGGFGGRGGPGGDMFGSDLYYISFLGTPSITTPWMLQFGGHHLALNISMVGGKGIMTPSLTGAQPASFQLNGKTIRPVGRESDKALALLQSLDAGQRKQAILGYTVADLVLGPGEDGKKIAPEGLKASAMNAGQRAMLVDLIAEWTGIMNQTSAAARMTQLQAELNDTWFAWSGPTNGQAGTNITAYYRIQGPHLVIEYAPQRDEPDNHVHTIYRDPENDYARALTKP